MTPLQDMNHPPRTKKTYTTNHGVSSSFRRQMALNAQYPNSSDDKLIQEKLYKNNCNTANLASSYNQEVREQEIS